MISRFRRCARYKKILLSALICAAAAAIIWIAVAHYEEAPAPIAAVFELEAELSDAPPEQISAYRSVIEDYRVVLNLSDPEWQSGYAAYTEQYPMINPSYVNLFHAGMVDTLYAACHDLDGNDTAELFIGIGDRESAMEVGVYGFNGSEAVLLSLTDTASGYHILADGTFFQSDKGGRILAVKRIAADGSGLETASDSDMRPGMLLKEIDLSAHGNPLSLDTWGIVPLQ